MNMVLAAEMQWSLKAFAHFALILKSRISIACGMFSQQLDTGSPRCSYLVALRVQTMRLFDYSRLSRVWHSHHEARHLSAKASY